MAVVGSSVVRHARFHLRRFSMGFLLAGAAAITAACTGGDRRAVDSVAARPYATSSPSFEIGLWPGEGTPVIAAVRGGLPLMRSPSDAAAVTGTLHTDAGGRVAYDSTRFQTIAPATVRVTGSSAAVHGRFLGAVRSLSRDRYYSDAFRDTTIDVAPSQHFQFLQPRAEGSCFVRIDGSVIEADPCPSHDAASFAVSGEPALRWWIFVAGDSASGWLLVSDSTAKVVRREF